VEELVSWLGPWLAPRKKKNFLYIGKWLCYPLLALFFPSQLARHALHAQGKKTETEQHFNTHHTRPPHTPPPTTPLSPPTAIPQKVNHTISLIRLRCQTPLQNPFPFSNFVFVGLIWICGYLLCFNLFLNVVAQCSSFPSLFCCYVVCLFSILGLSILLLNYMAWSLFYFLLVRSLFLLVNFVLIVILSVYIEREIDANINLATIIDEFKALSTHNTSFLYILNYVV
jgi:hypothetical protein